MSLAVHRNSDSSHVTRFEQWQRVILVRGKTTLIFIYGQVHIKQISQFLDMIFLAINYYLVLKNFIYISFRFLLFFRMLIKIFLTYRRSLSQWPRTISPLNILQLLKHVALWQVMSLHPPVNTLFFFTPIII